MSKIIVKSTWNLTKKGAKCVGVTGCAAKGSGTYLYDLASVGLYSRHPETLCQTN